MMARDVREKLIQELAQIHDRLLEIQSQYGHGIRFKQARENLRLVMGGLCLDARKRPKEESCNEDD